MPHKWIYWAVPSSILLLALLLRLAPFYTAWPVRFAPEVQFTSALAARYVWLTKLKPEMTSEEKDWTTTRVGRFVEPPITQYLTAFGYHLLQKETPVLSTVWTSLFWMVATFFLLKIATFLSISPPGQWSSILFFLFTPFGFLLSLSFQPEALLVSTFLASSLLIIKYSKEETLRSHLKLGISVGILGLSKPGLGLFPLLTLYFFTSSPSKKNQVRLFRLNSVLFSALLFLPSVIYTLWYIGYQPGYDTSIVTSGFVHSHLTTRYIEHLKLLPNITSFVSKVVGWPAFGLSVFAIFLWGNVQTKQVAKGWLTGYLVNVIIFCHALDDYDKLGVFASYYHWPLVPLTSLGLGVAIQEFLKHFHWSEIPFKSKIAYLVVSMGLILNLALPGIKLASESSFENVANYETLNKVVPKGQTAVVLSHFLSQDVRFFSWIKTQSWDKELEFRKLIHSKQYATLQTHVIDEIQRIESKFLIIVRTNDFDTDDGIRQRFRKLPEIFNQGNIIVLDTTSLLKMPKLEVKHAS